MQTDDYLADYALLGLQPGCSLETLERTWRLAVRDLHPDRAQDGLDSDVRTQRLHQITGAYRRLRGFEREHGRLPGGLMKPGDAVKAGEAAGAGGEPQRSDAAEVEHAHWHPPGASPARSRLLAGLALVVIGLLVWASLRTEPSASPQAEFALTSSSPTSPPGVGRPEPLSPRPGSRIRVGSTETQVERLMGAPLVTEPDLWQYGPSHVRFERGRVVGWYSSPLKPLPVDLESR